jgi:hypothetical protein
MVPSSAPKTLLDQTMPDGRVFKKGTAVEKVKSYRQQLHRDQSRAAVERQQCDEEG